MSHSTHYRSFRRQFYRSDDPTDSVTAQCQVLNSGTAENVRPHTEQQADQTNVVQWV